MEKYTYNDLMKETIPTLIQIGEEIGCNMSGIRLKSDIIKAIMKYQEMSELEEENMDNTSRHSGAEPINVSGVLDIMNDGYGFLRVEGLITSEGDIFVPSAQIKRFNLKTGDGIIGDAMQFDDKRPTLVYLKEINGLSINEHMHRKSFERLTPIYPDERITLGKGNNDIALNLIDIISPIGKGQRGLIVAPPKAGKTTIVKSISKSISENHKDIKLMIVLIDERPEEVTDMIRSVPSAEVIASTFDRGASSHCRVAEMAMERAKRLVETGQDVVILLDSLTRLTRAYNLNNEYSGKVMSGGIDPNAFFPAKKFFGSGRNIEKGGSLTVIATVLIETGSRMDDVIFEEFKGTGNMELKLDRGLQEKRIFPAIDIGKSGTRKEDLLLTPDEIKRSYQIRDMVSNGSRIDYGMYRNLIDNFSKIIHK